MVCKPVYIRLQNRPSVYKTPCFLPSVYHVVDVNKMTKPIENLECSPEFGRLNFEESSYINKQNKLQPEVLMTRDGFTFLAVGVTKRYPPFCLSTEPGPLWKILGLTIIYTDMNICINRRVVKRYHAGFLSLN